MVEPYENCDKNGIHKTENICSLTEDLEDDKVVIYPTTITINNIDVRDIANALENSCGISSVLDDIKTEPSLDVCNNSITNNVRVKDEVIPIGEIKIEFKNELFFCEYCQAHYEGYCTKCGVLVHILNRNVFSTVDDKGRGELPNDILEFRESLEGTGIFALKIIPEGVKFGPFFGLSGTEYYRRLKGGKFIVDENTSKFLSWMQYINPAKNISEQNLSVYESEGNLYYRSTCEILDGEELLVYFGGEYDESLNKGVKMDFIPTIERDVKDVFACTFCCLGFSSRLYLTKHKSICPNKMTENISTEELVQCHLCNIYLDEHEYLQCHMNYCRDRNVRKFIPLAPDTQTIQSKRGRKRRLQMHKCVQCNFRTTFRGDLRSHTNNQHYKVKMCRCEICYKRFKTREFLKVHVENTHIEDDKSGIQRYSTSDIKRNRMAKNISMKKFTRRKPVKANYYKCEICKFKTNYKANLERHVKSKHLKQFDYKCDLCEYKTCQKQHLETHIKSNHLKQFDYKCDLCEYKTCRKQYLEIHIKSDHLKQFDYKCDFCEFKTCRKQHLEIHIKSKHLKQFHYNCDLCEYKTNQKQNLKFHIKSKHLKQFDYKCDLCEYKTYRKEYFEIHIKSKHLKQFDHKCDLCEFKTSRKQHLEIHIKSKHLEQFDYKCDICEYKTTHKISLNVHIKSKHFKEFDYKCENCDYKTNNNTVFKNHVKSLHLKIFKYKCDKCEFRSNYSGDLKRHKKSKQH